MKSGNTVVTGEFSRDSNQEPSQASKPSPRPPRNTAIPRRKNPVQQAVAEMRAGAVSDRYLDQSHVSTLSALEAKRAELLVLQKDLRSRTWKFASIDPASAAFPLLSQLLTDEKQVVDTLKSEIVELESRLERVEGETA